MRVFITGTFDPIHAGHIRFMRAASRFGELYVGIGSDESVEANKHDVFYPQEHRLMLVKAIKYVKDASINPGMGNYDFEDNPLFKEADILIVNYDQHDGYKKKICLNAGKQYIVVHVKRITSSTFLRCRLLSFLRQMGDPVF